MKNIPDKINMFNCYSSGNVLLGITEEVTLPDLEAITETISGPGVLGELDVPAIGMFSAMEQEIPFRTVTPEMIGATSPLTGVDITLRGSIQTTDSNGAISFVGMRVVERGIFKSFTGGSMKQGSPMNPSLKFEVTYYLLEIDGEAQIEIDKLNGVYKVQGVDLLKKARSLC